MEDVKKWLNLHAADFGTSIQKLTPRYGTCIPASDYVQK
jgi:hypothetical protein